MGVLRGILEGALGSCVMALTPGLALAHVSLAPAAAPAAAYQVLRFGVGHGCAGGKPTTGLRVEIPAGVEVARPQPKPGWTLVIEKSASAPAPRAVEWRGELAPEHFDEFVMLVKLPAAEGPLAFPAVQSCGERQIRWDEAPGGRGGHPAPSLTVEPADGR